MRNLLLFFAICFALSASRCGVQAQPLQPWTLRVSNKANGGVSSVAWSGDGKTLAVGTANEIQLWNTHRKSLRRVLKWKKSADPQESGFFEVALSPRSGIVAARYQWQMDSSIRLLDSHTGRTVTSFTGNLPVFIKNEHRFVSGYGMNGYGNYPSGLDFLKLTFWKSNPVKALNTVSVVAPRGFKFILPGVSSSGPPPPQWALAPNARSGAIKVFRGQKSEDGEISDRYYESGGTLLFDPRSGKTGRLLPTQGEFLWFSADSRILIVWGRDVQLWDVANHRLRLIVKPNGEWDIAELSPDNNVLAVSYSTGANTDTNTIRLWNARNGRLLRELKGHRAAVTWLAFSPDGKTLASGSDDGTVKLWRVK